MNPDDYTKLNWEATGGRLIDFDDGHIPEVCRRRRQQHSESSSPSSVLSIPTKMLEYPDLFERQLPQVRVYPNAFPEDLTDALYQKTKASEHPAWGDYVTIQQVEQFWATTKKNRQRKDDVIPTNDASNCCKASETEDVEEGSMLLVQLVARYLELAMTTTTHTNCSEDASDNSDTVTQPTFTTIGESKSTLFTAQDLERAHGVAVWSLRSTKGAEVGGNTCNC